MPTPMKIRINNQIFETDENTLSDWIQLGRIPGDAELSCETLTNGKWRAIHEIDLEVDANPRLLEEKLEQTKKSPSHRRKLPKVTLVLIAINAIAFILLDQGRGYSKDSQLLTQFGAYSYSLIVEAGEYWRLIANTFLHVGSLHFGLNMMAILVLGYRVERLFGRWRYLIIYLIAAIGGSLVSLLFIHIPIGAGASGAFFGLAGALVAFGLRYRKQISREHRRECRLILICIGIDIFVMPFFMRDINTVAHVGGLICGVVVGLLLPPVDYINRERERKTVIAFASALVALTLLSGALAVSNFFLNSTEAVEERIATAGAPPHDAAELPSYIERYEKLLRQRGYGHGYYYHLALLYMQMMENEPENPSWVSKLKKLYERGLLMAPQQLAWHRGLLWLYDQTAFKQPDEQEQLKSYIDLYNKVIRRHGYHLRLYRSQEYFYLRAKELEPQHKAPWGRRLEQLYKKAVPADPDDATWPNNFAWLYVQQKKKPRKAVQLAQQAVKLEPQNPVLLDTLGWAYVRNKQYNKALRVFELVLGTPEERLFGIPLKFQTDLDNNHFSEDLRTAFGNYGLILPPNAKITINTEQGKWLITIYGANQVTLVVKREKNRLNVYTIENETILKAQESSWDGMTELLESDIDPLGLEKFSQAFLRFYNRMSRQLMAGSSAQARLDAIFNLFQSNHAQPLKE